MFAMPQYEVKFHDKEEWEGISEIDLMSRLHDFFDQVTPAIQQMIQGDPVLTPDAVYRLKVQSNTQFCKG